MPLIQLTVADSLLERAKLVAERAQGLHDKEVEALAKRIQACASDKQAASLSVEWTRLHLRGRYITHQNVMRVAALRGLREITPEEALAAVVKEGIPLGRPLPVKTAK